MAAVTLRYTVELLFLHFSLALNSADLAPLAPGLEGEAQLWLCF